MPVCPHCGQEIETGSESCSACGVSLLTPQENVPLPSVPERITIKEVKIGKYFKEGWKFFKKFPAGFIFYGIIVNIILNVVAFIPLIGLLAALSLIYPLNAGFFVVTAKILDNKISNFSDFFKGFKFFLQLALLGVVSSILICIGLILLIAPGIYLIVSYLFAFMFVVDRGFNFWSAMETSRRSIQTRWFAIFNLWVLTILLFLCPLLLGGMVWVAIVIFRNILYAFFLLLCIPLMLVIGPLSFCILTVAYVDIFGLNSAQNI